MIFCIGILRPNSEILLFCSVNTGCFVECNACYVLHFVTAIILFHTKNIYEICNCKPHRLKANFPFKSINIWKSYCKNTKGSRFSESQCSHLYMNLPFSSEPWQTVLAIETLTVNKAEALQCLYICCPLRQCLSLHALRHQVVSLHLQWWNMSVVSDQTNQPLLTEIIIAWHLSFLCTLPAWMITLTLNRFQHWSLAIPYRALTISQALKIHAFICRSLSIPRHNLSFGARAFRVAAPKIWNSIPLHICQSQTCSSFRRHFKTDYFHSAYPAP